LLVPPAGKKKKGRDLLVLEKKGGDVLHIFGLKARDLRGGRGAP